MKKIKTTLLYFKLAKKHSDIYVHTFFSKLFFNQIEKRQEAHNPIQLVLDVLT